MLKTASPVRASWSRPRRRASYVAGKFSRVTSSSPHSLTRQPRPSRSALLRSNRSRFTSGIASPSQISCATAGNGEPVASTAPTRAAPRCHPANASAESVASRATAYAARIANRAPPREKSDAAPSPRTPAG